MLRTKQHTKKAQRHDVKALTAKKKLHRVTKRKMAAGKPSGFTFGNIKTPQPSNGPSSSKSRSSVFSTQKFQHARADSDGESDGDSFITPPNFDEQGGPVIPRGVPSYKRGGLFDPSLKEDLHGAVERDRSFLKEGMPSDAGKYLLEGVERLHKMAPNKLDLVRKTIDKERVDLSALTIFPYLENIKGAIIHHDLEQVLASISGIMKYGAEPDVFDGRLDDEDVIMKKIQENMEKHKVEYKTLLDNVRAISEVISYDLEIASKLLNQNSNIDKIHCTINTLQHLFNVYHIVPIPLNDPQLRTEHCSLDVIAEKIVKRSEEIDIPENGLEVYKDRFKREPIRIITPLIGALYMLLLKRYGYTAGVVHTPTVGLVFATPPISRKTVTDPELQERMKQGSPYWYIGNLVTNHAEQYRRTSLKLTPVDCGGLCTPSFSNKNMKNLIEEFTCSCLASPEAGYGGNFIYIDYLVNKVGQIPFTYQASSPEEKILIGGLDLSSEVKHSIQQKFNWDLPYPIYSYKTLAMRCLYEPIFARDIPQFFSTNLELVAAHLSSHISNDAWRPKIQEVEYLEVEPDSDDLREFDDIAEAEEFEKFIQAKDASPKL